MFHFVIFVVLDYLNRMSQNVQFADPESKIEGELIYDGNIFSTKKSFSICQKINNAVDIRKISKYIIKQNY